jgi:hypothetical protein
MNELANVTLKNTLSDKERLAIPRLLGHDTASILSIISSSVRAPLRNEKFEGDEIKTIQRLVDHIANVHGTIKIITQRDDINLVQNAYTDYFSSEKSFEYFFETMNAALGAEERGNLELTTEKIEGFLSKKRVLYTMLYNLSKNGLAAQQEPGNILITTHQPMLLPGNISFVPDGASDYKFFIPFNICNKGEFPKGKNILEHFSESPRLGERGFGLYFVGLAARVLRIPINVNSSDGKTITTLYHPIYCS